ncbi:MAG TPA: DinB family protein [Bryobacteraceae bacterium]|jgi:uncharacterized damage-inducible protein DinB
MKISEVLLLEFEEEMAGTRRMLERLPEEQFAWKPHDKSPTLGRLANHVSIIPGLASLIVNRRGAKPQDSASKAEMLAAFDRNVGACRETLASLTDEQLTADIRVTPELSKPLAAALRKAILNHLIHHRAQLGVYLRLLDVPVPGMYGPSADEKS